MRQRILLFFFSLIFHTWAIADSVESYETSDTRFKYSHFDLTKGECWISSVNEGVVLGHLHEFPKKLEFRLVIKKSTYMVGYPSTYKDTLEMTVVGIDNYAFNGRDDLTSVTIPDQIKTIGNGAFKDCKNLTNASISTPLEAIPASLFSGCEKLKTFSIPSTVTSIGNYAFNGCSSLSGIKFPSKLSTIGMRAFKDCSKLDNISISSSVGSVGSEAFANCTALAKLTIEDREEILTFTDGSTFSGAALEYVYIGGDFTKNVFSGNTAILKVVLAGRTSEIKDYEFSKCENLQEVTIPTSINKIGRNAFSGTGLTSITVPNSITNMGINVFTNCKDLTTADIRCPLVTEAMFSGCISLESVTIPETTVEMGERAFYECSNLKFINKIFDIGVRHSSLPDNIKIIEAKTFYKCSSLELIDLPSQLESINEEAFYDCTGLKKVSIPRSVNYIGSSAFYNCIGLKKVNVEWDVPLEGWKSIFSCMSDEEHDAYFIYNHAKLHINNTNHEEYRKVSPWMYFRKHSHPGCIIYFDYNTGSAIDLIELIIGVIYGTITDPTLIAVADVNNDGKVNATDIVCVVNEMME